MENSDSQTTDDDTTQDSVQSDDMLVTKHAVEEDADSVAMVTDTAAEEAAATASAANASAATDFGCSESKQLQQHDRDTAAAVAAEAGSNSISCNKEHVQSQQLQHHHPCNNLSHTQDTEVAAAYTSHDDLDANDADTENYGDANSGDTDTGDSKGIPHDVINNEDSLPHDTDDDVIKGVEDTYNLPHYSPISSSNYCDSNQGDSQLSQFSQDQDFEFEQQTNDFATAIGCHINCNQDANSAFNTETEYCSANEVTPIANGIHCSIQSENAESEEENRQSIASLSAADTDDSQMTFIEDNAKHECNSDVNSDLNSDATAPNSVNASPRPIESVARGNSHFENLHKEFSTSPRADSSDRSLPTSREGSIPRDSGAHASSPERASVVIKRKANRPRGRESILQKLTDSLLAKKERAFKDKFSDSESNGAGSPMHFSDSNDSFTMGPETVAKNNLGLATVYNKISESDSSNHSPAPTPPPRDLNESGPRKPNIRWNFNRVKQLRNVISNILDRETVALERESNLQHLETNVHNSGIVAPVVNGNDHSNSKDNEPYVNGQSKDPYKPKFGEKKRKNAPLKQPKPLNATNGIIKCKFCPFSKESGIGAKSAVQRHERCHYTHGPFTCKICTFSTNNWNSIKMHKQLHIRVGDCMPDEDCITRSFKNKKNRGRIPKAKKNEEKKPNEIDYSAFQRSLNEESVSTPRMYSSQSVYPGGPPGQGDYGLMDGYPSATPVEQSHKQMPNLARITSSPASSPGRGSSPAPYLTPALNHHSSPSHHSPIPLARVSQTSSPSRTPIHMTTLHPVDLTNQALDLTTPALDLSSRRDNSHSSNDPQDSSMDLSLPRESDHHYSEGQTDYPVDLSVSSSNKSTSSMPEVYHYNHSTSGYNHQVDHVDSSWHQASQMNAYNYRSESPSPQRSVKSHAQDSYNHRNNHSSVKDHEMDYTMNSASAISPVASIASASSDKSSPAAKGKYDHFIANCPFCPFEATGHKAVRAVVMKHQTCHYADRRYKCDICKFSSDTVDIMRNHILLHPVEERNVLRNGVSIGGSIQPLRKRTKPKAGGKSQGEGVERVKSPCGSEISTETDASYLSANGPHEETMERSTLSPQTSPVPPQTSPVPPQTSPVPKRRKRKISTNVAAETGVDLSLSTPEKVPEPPLKCPGPIPGSRAATLISETEIRKVSPPPKKRFMEKVVAEREAAKLNELKATEQAAKERDNKSEVMTNDTSAVQPEAKVEPQTIKKEVKPTVKPIERKPRARRSRLLFADEQALLDERPIVATQENSDKQTGINAIESRRPSSASDLVDYDSEDFLKGFQKLNILHCPYCPFKTTGRSHGAKHNLAKHERCHGMTARFVCEVCSFGTKYMDSYKKHQLLHIDNPNFKPRKCPPEMAPIPTKHVGIPKRKIVSKKTGIKKTAGIKESRAAAMMNIIASVAAGTAGALSTIGSTEASAQGSPGGSAEQPTTAPVVEKTRRRKGIRLSKTPLKKFNLKCRHCPFQTGANYAAKYNLFRHEKAHFQDNAFKCDHCTFSSAEYRKFKLHQLLHVEGDSTMTGNQDTPKQGASKEVTKQNVKQEALGQSEELLVSKHVATRRPSKDSQPEASTSSQALGNAKDAVPASPMKAENVKLKGKAANKDQKAAFNKRWLNLKQYKGRRGIKVEPQTPPNERVTATVAKQEPMDTANHAISAAPIPSAANKTQKKKALSMLQKVARARNIKKSLILSCKYCPFKTCGTSAAARYNLKLHEDCHFRVSTYRCEICSFTTKKFIVIKKHRLLHGENVDEGNLNPLNKLKCDACGFGAEDLRSLEQHKLMCHPSQNLDQEARLADTPPSMPSPEMKPEASGDAQRQQQQQNGVSAGQPQNLTTVQTVQGIAAVPAVGDKQTKKMLEIPAELWYDAESQLYHCQWCDFTSKREHFFKVHLYCHQRKNVKFRCNGCGYGATRQAFLDHHYKEHHKEDVKNKVWTSKEERAAVLKPKDLYTAVTERLKMKGLDETLIETFSPSKSKGKSQPSTTFLVPAVPPPKPSTSTTSQPSLKRPTKPSSPRAKKRRCHPIPAHAANPTGPERRFLCSLCPFSTTSLEVHNKHEKKHLLPDQFSCPYCTYNTRTRVYLEKHIKLHFTASLQDEAIKMLPLDFTQNLVRTEPKPVVNWELDTSNLGKAKRQTKSLPRKQCRFCDRLIPVDELKHHEDRHLVGCAYLKFIDCSSPTHESEPN